MSELLRETINAAERVVAGEDSQVADYLERLLNSPGELRSGEDSERIYLAALLDFIGLHEKSARVLRDAPDAMSRNMEGMLAAAHGQHKQARNILVKALNEATDSPLLRKQILANLAAVSLRTGSVGEAEAWIEGAAAAGQAGNPAVDVLIATVRTSIASRRGDLPTLLSAAASLEEASKSRLAELGTEHPQALTVVANMATAEIMVARAENSAVRLERAIDVLEVAAVRLAAEFGADHPQAKAAMASLAAARTEPAPADAAVLVTTQVSAEERQPAAARVTARKSRRMSAKSGGLSVRAARASSARRADKGNSGLGGGMFGISPGGAVAVSDRPGWSRRRQPSWSWRRNYLREVALADLGCAVAGTFAAAQLRFGDNVSSTYLILSLAMPLLWLFSVKLAGGYDARFIGDGPEEFRKILSVGLVLTAAGAIISYTVNGHLSRSYLLVALPSITLLDLIARYAMRKRLHRRRAAGRCMQRVLAVGHELAVADLVTELRLESSHGLNVVGACLARPGEHDEVADVLVYGGLDDVMAAVQAFDVDTVAVLACPEMDSIRLRNLAWELEKTGTDLCVSPALLDVAGPRTTIRPTAGLTLLHVDHPRLDGPWLVLKGLFDRCAAAVALIMFAPVMAAIAMAIWLHDRGPALFTQFRVGKDGRTFRMYKFRTMVVDAKQREALLASNDSDGVLFKLRADPRVTAVGAHLRRWSLDELPQLFNVLMGDMSLVGPRPDLPEAIGTYAEHVRRRLVVKPGITGLWQVNGRSDLSWEESVRLDLRYVENWSFMLDLQILGKTVSAVVRGSGAY